VAVVGYAKCHALLKAAMVENMNGWEKAEMRHGTILKEIARQKSRRAI
jgi:hypothetical protein